MKRLLEWRTDLYHRLSTSKINRLWRCWQQSQDISGQRRWPGWRLSHRAIMERHHSRASAAKNTLRGLGYAAAIMTCSVRDDGVTKGTPFLEQLHNSQELEKLYSTFKSKSTCCQVFCSLGSRVVRNSWWGFRICIFSIMEREN